MTTTLQIVRESTCLADDFVGPLDMALEIRPSTPLNDVLEVIAASGFLQFSGPLTAFSGGNALARISSDGQIEYFASRSLPASECFVKNELEFRFARTGL